MNGGKFVSGAATAAFSAALVDKKVEENQLAIEKDKLIRVRNDIKGRHCTRT